MESANGLDTKLIENTENYWGSEVTYYLLNFFCILVEFFFYKFFTFLDNILFLVWIIYSFLFLFDFTDFNHVLSGKDVSTRDIVSSIISAANRKIQRKPRSKPSTDKKWLEEKRVESPSGSPPNSPLTSPPPHLTTSLAEYDGLPHRIRQHEGVNK